MRCVVQRVSSASVRAELETGESYFAEISGGFLVLVGVRADDTKADAVYLAEKVAGLRVFEDDGGKMNRSLIDTGGAVLVVSNFTLYGDCRKGRRPSFAEAAAGPQALELYRTFGATIERFGIKAEYGSFGADMQIALVNDGPVTLLLDSGKQF